MDLYITCTRSRATACKIIIVSATWQMVQLGKKWFDMIPAWKNDGDILTTIAVAQLRIYQYLKSESSIIKQAECMPTLA